MRSRSAQHLLGNSKANKAFRSSRARSRAGGHFFLGDQAPKQQINNGAVLNIAAIQRNIMSSAAEAEVGALFTNTKEGSILRTTLAEMGHPQPPTPVQTDNSTASGIVNDTIKQQRSRAMDMRFYWVKDRVQQGQFEIYWAPGGENLADYFTKHHPPNHHQRMRSTYLHATTSPHLIPISQDRILRGCVETPQLRQPAMGDSRGKQDAAMRTGRGARARRPDDPGPITSGQKHASLAKVSRAHSLANPNRISTNVLTI